MGMHAKCSNSLIHTKYDLILAVYDINV